MDLYPLKFKPWLRTMVWGGEKIAKFKEIFTTINRIGESWEISAVEGHVSVVENGPLAGKSLTELMHMFKSRLVGKKVWHDTGDDKTEMWYVVGADKGAHLLSGLTQEISPEEYEDRVRDHTITDVLARHDIAPGDVFFLPAGRIHAICAGSFVAEIQQTSDLTYRIYDYGRLGLDGKPRDLHIEQAKEAIDYTVHDDYKTGYVRRKNAEIPLVSCKYFTTTLFDVDKACSKDLSGMDSFLVVMCVGGKGTLIDSEPNGLDYAVDLRQGETVLIPATSTGISLRPDGSMTCLTSCIQ